MSKHPMQKIEVDDRGVIRFRANRIIKDLLDSGAIDLNKIAMAGYDEDDEMQLAQLIGYSVSGYGDLSYASKRSVRKADRRAERLIAKTRGDGGQSREGSQVNPGNALAVEPAQNP